MALGTRHEPHQNYSVDGEATQPGPSSFNTISSSASNSASFHARFPPVAPAGRQAPRRFVTHHPS
jgi:hypothetical protein